MKQKENVKNNQVGELLRLKERNIIKKIHH